MADFKFLNYHTEYKVHGTQNKAMRPEACFAYVFGGPDYMENIYEIRIYRGLAMAKKGRDNNCFLDKKQLFHHISVLKKLYGFSFSIEEELNKDMISYFKLNLCIKGNNLIHRFILTWIRYLYEFPYNLYILDTYRLKNVETFKYVNPINIFNIVAGFNSDGNSGHMFTIPGFLYKILKFDGIKKSVINKPYRNLSSVFINTDLVNWDNANKPNKDLNNVTDWDENFVKRVPKYIDIYNKIKRL